MLDLAIGTIAMRPYVFAFFGAFLLACVPHVGWKKTASFIGAGYLIAFVSEKLSISAALSMKPMSLRPATAGG